MVRQNHTIGRPWNNDPITSRVSASAICILVVFCCHGFMPATVWCDRIKDDSSLSPRNGAEGMYPPTATTSFNCPTEWAVHQDSCFRLIATPSTRHDAGKVCESYDSVVADLLGSIDWTWLDDFIQVQFNGNASTSNTAAVKTFIRNSTNETRLWTGIQRFPNGTFLWSDGSYNLSLHHGSVETQNFDKDEGRMCVETSTAFRGRRSPHWTVADCGERKPFVCKMKACGISMIHCPWEARCIQPEWICDGHVDCGAARDEVMCNKTNEKINSPSQVSFCGETLKGNQGSFVSPNHPSTYPPLSHCLWTIETDLDKVLILTVHYIDIEDIHDSVRIYDGVKMAKSKLLRDMVSCNQSEEIRMTGNLATIQFLSDTTIHKSGFQISWMSEFHAKNVRCGQKLLAVEATSVLYFNITQLKSSKTFSDQPIMCDWLLSTDDMEGHVSLQITSLELGRGESLKLFDGSDVNDSMIVHYHISRNESQTTFGSNEDHLPWASRILKASFFIPALFVSSKNTLRLQLMILEGSSAHVKISYHSGCDQHISIFPMIFQSPGFASSRYSNNLNCSWNFEEESKSHLGQPTLLLFPGFLTEDGKDILKIYDHGFSSSATSYSPIQFSGSINELQSMSFTSNFTVHFTSDSTVNRGQWIAAVSYGQCNLPNSVDNLIIKAETTRFGSTIYFSCEEGYTLVGHDTSVCGVSGEWSPTDLPVCLETLCGSPPVPNDGYVSSLTGVRFGSLAVFQCHNGFRLHGNESSVCGSNGWSKIPSCQEIICPKELPPHGGNAQAEDLRFGALRIYYCKPPFRLNGSKFSHCNASGQWTDEVPTCEPLGCSLPPRLVNGKFNVTGSVNVGETIEAYCDDGFEIEGPKYLTCLKDLSFGNLLPTCTDVDECLTAQQPCKSHYCQNYHGGFHCFCQPGFMHPDLQNSKECIDIDECEENNDVCSHSCINMPGNYSCHCPTGMDLYSGVEAHVGNRTLVPFHTCIAVCSALIIKGNGQVVYKSRSLDSGQYVDGIQAVIKCPPGSYLEGEPVVTCNDSGDWSPSGQECKEYLCDAPAVIQNGEVTYDGLSTGSRLTYRCHIGFQLRGPSYRFCLPVARDTLKENKEYSWSGQAPVCEIKSCPLISSPDHGQVFLSSLLSKAKAIFRCDCGYRLVGVSVVECSAMGTWSRDSPFCEVESCPQPDTPQHAVITHTTPGFPVWSVVKYHCQGQGYEMSGPSVITCQPQNYKKISDVALLYQITLGITLNVEQSNLSLADCLTDFENSIVKSIEQFAYRLTISYCSEMDVHAFHLGQVETHSQENVVDLTTNVSLSSENTFSSYLCAKTLSSINSQGMEMFWTEKVFSLNSSFTQIVVRPTKMTIQEGEWHCWKGLTLNETGDKNSQPICLEECTHDASSVDESENVQNHPIDPSRDYDIRIRDDLVSEQFQYPLQPQDESTRSGRSEKMHHEENFAFSSEKSTPLYTKTTTRLPILLYPSTNLPLRVSTTSNRPYVGSKSTIAIKHTSSSVKERGSSDFVYEKTSPSPISHFDLDSTKERVYFNGDENFPSGSNKQTEQILWRQHKRTNCSSSRNQTQVHQTSPTSLRITASSSSSPNRASNVEDCSDNQMLEKQETKFVHTSNEPSANFSTPIYTIEVRDQLDGSFFNISCVDAVHMIVNAKVNEVLQQFGQLVGHQVCKDSPDITLELVAGNIRFKGTTARVYIKFAITYTTSPISKIMECGVEFESFVTVQLPQALALYLPMSLRTNCGFINYTGLDFTLARRGWDCQKGYTLHAASFECSVTPVNKPFPSKSRNKPFDVVKSLPRLKMNFNGVFNVLGNQRPTRSICVDEYKTGISLALAKIEPYLQARFFQCANLYIKPSKNVSVLFTGKRIIAKSSIHLAPLKTSVDLASMTKCSRFLSLQFRDPSSLLTTVTLGQRYLPTCPPIRLMPHGIRANLHFIYYCLVGFYYEPENFKCIHESLPMYSSGFDLRLQGPMDNLACQNSIQLASVQLVRSVLIEMKQRIHYQHICNGSTDVILVPTDGHFDIQLSKFTVKLIISIISLKGQKKDLRSCMADIHSRLEAMLIGPKATLIQKVTQKCNSNLFTIPRRARLTYTKWECHKGRVYNSATGNCDLVLPQMHSNGLKTTRRMRSVNDDASTKPVWRGQPPTCIDVTPPTLHQCPDRDVIIILNHLGPKYLNIPLPAVVDNSGEVPKIVFHPADFELPYKFTQNMSLTVTAFDSNLNKAQCHINIVVLDNIAPVISCPTESMKIPFISPLPVNPQDNEDFRHFLDRAVHAWDNSGHVTVQYTVIGDIRTESLSNVMVKAVAEDENLNIASCNFFVTLEAPSCSVSSLPDPVNGLKKCVETRDDPGGISCSLSCQSGKIFAVRPPIQYICANKNVKWVPHKRVPICYDAYFPDFKIMLTFNISYRDISISDCVRRTALSLKTSSNSTIMKLCGASVLQNLNFTVSTSQSFSQYSMSNVVSSTLKILIHMTRESYSLKSPLAVWCGTQLVPQLNKWINSSLRHQCVGRDINPVFSYPIKNVTCATGWALVNSLCVECPKGTYWSKLRCLECPVGSFQSHPGKTSCDLCASNFSTRTAGAQNENECLAICPANSYSPDGLEPCVPCPVGTYQQGQTATHCNKCGKDELTSQPFCQDICGPGMYGWTGKKPCYPCPRHTYNDGYGMTHCVLCPEGLTTENDGADKLEICQDHNLCNVTACNNRGQCRARGGQITCACSTGYTGPKCKALIDPCDTNPCMNDGICLKDGHNFSCSCKNGYTGIHCETYPDYCRPNPCDHGICVPNGTGFYCLCTPGFEGSKCNIDVDNCTDLTCLNGGHCRDLVNDFKCICKSGYTGKICETDNDECVTGVCLHGGTCVDGTDSFSCLCPQGFTGSFCEIPVDECDSNPCLHGGICENQNHGNSCICTMGYTGKLCENGIDFCESSPCWNGGRCDNIHNTSIPMFSCSCKEGFTGVVCQNRIDYCNSMPCSLKGTERCENERSGYVCHCHAGWTGKMCEQEVNLCDENQCLNNGTCVGHHGNAFSCSCQPNFTGIRCSEPINKCQADPCHNKGKCVNYGTEHSCLCSHGFTGKFCEDNIDECQSYPCRNGGTCQDGVNSFFCRCAKGYAGTTCDIHIDQCLSQLCPGKAVCVQVEGTFHCQCAPGTTGENCEVDFTETCNPNTCQNGKMCVKGIDGDYNCQYQDGYNGDDSNSTESGGQNCSEYIVCLNGGSCMWNSIAHGMREPMCLCHRGFEGPHCEKERTSTFDLQFPKPNTICILEPVIVDYKSELSLCLWVQILGGNYTEKFVSMEIIDKLNATTHLTLKGESVVISSFDGSIYTDVMIHDGYWHHICVVLIQHSWTVYIDGSMIHHGKAGRMNFDTVKRMLLHVGQPQYLEDRETKSTLRVTELHLYGYVLDDKQIQKLSKKDHFNNSHGDILDWEAARTCGNANIDVISPSMCPMNGMEHIQSPGKQRPIIAFCPDDIHIVTEKSPIVVTWNEPAFHSVSDIVSLQQTFYSGQALPHGNHLVSYTALDSQGIRASCSFHIFISRFECIDPAPPVNGARVCGEWHHGRYCIPSCLPNFMFISPVPPFYLCGKDGAWNPSSGQPFQFPMCARTVPPILSIYGTFQLEGPVCNAAFLQQLQNHMDVILTQVDDTIGLCKNQKQCDYTQALYADCGERKKEDVNVRNKRNVQNAGIYTMRLNITFTSYEMSSHENKEWLLEDFVSALKKSPSLKQFHLSSVEVNVDNKCMKGFVMTGSSLAQNKCVECPRDYEIIDQRKCEPCPKGWYNDKPDGQLCQPCPKVLSNLVSTTCQERCAVGWYLQPFMSQCTPCPKGHYQDEEGASHCKACPVGMSTQGPGAVNYKDCMDLCSNGQELGPDGECIPCPEGRFKNRTLSPHCLLCPFAWTTLDTGAVSIEDCSIKKCKPGYFLDNKKGSCFPCPKGTFQSINSVLTRCQPCGVGLTTRHEGADEKSLCVEGEVDECKLGVDDCPDHTTCVDLKGGLFVCQCKFGLDNAGKCVKNKVEPALCDHLIPGHDVSRMSCACSKNGCKETAQKDYKSFLRTLTMYSMIGILVVTFLICISVAFVVYRQRKASSKRNHVRLYRKEKTVSAFQNNAFDVSPDPISVISCLDNDVHATTKIPGVNLSRQCDSQGCIQFHLSNEESNYELI